MSHSFWESYYQLVTHVVAGPKSTSYFIPLILLPAALCIPPSVLSRWQLAFLFLPPIIAFQLHAWSCMEGLDVISVNLTQWSFVLLVCHDPRSTFKRLRLRQKPSITVEHTKHHRNELDTTYIEEPYPTESSRRLPWVTTLLVSLRLSNWKIGEASHDQKQPVTPMTRAAFFKYGLCLAAQSFIILDLTSTWTRQDPYFHMPGMHIDEHLQEQTGKPAIYYSLCRHLPPRIPRAAVLAGQAYACITQGGSLSVLPIVALNAVGLWPDEWSPHTWPIFFGRFSAVSEKGLRGLWGTWWHQTNRYLSIPGRTLAQAMRISTNSTLGFMLQVVSAFLLSGIMHMGLIPPRPRGTSMTAMEMRFYIATFFWLQILGFGIELCVTKIVQRVTPRLSSSGVGRYCTLLWVTTWLSCTLPLLAIPFRELGYWTYPPLPLSLISRLGGGSWWVWP